MDSLRKSFKSHGSYKHTRKISAGNVGVKEEPHESRPILFDQDGLHTEEVVVNVDGNDDTNSTRDVELGVDPNGNKVWRESSYEFWNDGNGDGGNGVGPNGGSFNFSQKKNVMEDPPSRLIGEFLNKQKNSGVVSLDMDLEMDELQLQHDRLPPIAETRSINQPISISRDVRVSFREPESGRVEIAPEYIERHYKESSQDDDYDCSHIRKSSNMSGFSKDEVVRCTSNASFRRNSLLTRIKTKSRLMDPPAEDQYRKSGVKSGILKSGFVGKTNDDEEDDPFAFDDLPDDFNKGKWNTLTILQWMSLVLIVIAFVSTLTSHFLKDKRLWELEFWKWELLILVLICGRLLSGWGIRIVVFFVERNFLLRKRVLYFVYGLRKAVQNCLWLGLVLIAWHFLFDSKVEREVKNKALPYVNKVLICLLVGTLIWLVKTLFVKVLASSFHVSTYFDRIQDSLFNQYVIETLSGPPLMQLQNNQEDEEKIMAEVRKLQNAGVNVPTNFRDTAFSTMKSGRVIGSGGLQRKPSMIGKSIRYSSAVPKRQEPGITIDHLHKMNQKNISAWNMKRMMNIVRHGFMATIDERICDTSGEDESTMLIRSECEAKAAAKKIFNNVAKPRSKFIYVEDLMRFMREDEAIKTTSLFEGASELNRVNKSALKNWVVNAFRERRALALTLNDTKTAVNKLHQMVNFIVGIIIVVVWLIILGITSSRLVFFVGSQGLVAVFIFGNTCKLVFEAIIFLFVMHPFDVGDRCEVDGVQLVVEEMNILNTVFLRYDNQKIFYPNSVLATLPISNYYRSPDMGDTIEFSIHISTPTEKIAIMKQKITAYIESKKEHWYPAPFIVLKDVEDMNRLKWALWVTHTMNHQDMGERWVRRACLVEEMTKIFRDLDIEYRMLPLDINVRNMAPLSSTRLPSNWTACA